MSFAASTAGSLFGVFYLGIPVLLLLVAAGLFAGGGRSFLEAFLFGAVGGMLAIVAFVSILAGSEPEGTLERHMALLANAATCLGILLGVAVFRVLFPPSKGNPDTHRGPDA